ncbi:uroporphyrinogen-III C-methyltransferase [candidate division CSSED10-310 bacterium]|uniref:uroporphyrinogen-III C-methyltransferase n=1 Tax=candidate division CSSED10-310 bacterium TaxID=2855610 RepID=A0ABV6Z393_UNCC1
MTVLKGKVFLVGAGPGDPALITRKGADCLRKADVVIYDRLISKELLYLAPENAELIYVGKRPGEHYRKQDEINQIIIEKARAGKTIIRLKGGDPLVFGRGAEEALVMAAADIQFEIIPGVTAAVATSAYAGIPLTHRDWTSSVALITGHEAPDKTCGESVCWEKLATCIGTIVVYMGVKNYEKITTRILNGGRDPQTPAAIIYAGTTPWQKTIVGTLHTIAQQAHAEKMKPPAILIVGDVVRLRESIAWHEKRPLFGRRLVVTRSRSEKSRLAEELRARGAMVIEFPTLKINPPPDMMTLHQKIQPLNQYEWIVFSSPTGVKYFFDVLITAGGDSRNLSGTRIAVRDISTAEAIKQYGIKADFCGAGLTSSDMINSLITQQRSLKNKKILIPQKTEMRTYMVQSLQKVGAHVICVDVYQISPAPHPPDEFQEHYEAGLIDGICFTSSTSVSSFLALMNLKNLHSFNDCHNIFSIGPVTSAKIIDLDGTISAQADQHTILGLADTICEYYQRNGSKS